MYHCHQPIENIESLPPFERRNLVQLLLDQLKSEKEAASGEQRGDSIMRPPMFGEVYGSSDAEAVARNPLALKAARRVESKSGVADTTTRLKSLVTAGRPKVINPRTTK